MPTSSYMVLLQLYALQGPWLLLSYLLHLITYLIKLHQFSEDVPDLPSFAFSNLDVDSFLFGSQPPVASRPSKKLIVFPTKNY